uniref:Uncharacterized protein n=1 Tax=Anguilla anguilla TaxID=7936 RepID=A0A0E9V412_ANGAN
MLSFHRFTITETESRSLAGSLFLLALDRSLATDNNG